LCPIEEPRPRSPADAPPAWSPATSREHPLLAGMAGPALDFGAVLDARTSTRALTSPPTPALASVLWHGARTRAACRGWQHRAHASAGGLHPIRIVLVEADRSPALYDPMRHSLLELVCAAPEQVQNELCAVRAVVPSAQGVLLQFVAHAPRTQAAYEHPDSLLWRDAGCLIATLQLVATWHGLATCPLGILGLGLVQSIEANPHLVAVGAMILGLPANAAGELAGGTQPSAFGQRE
jgi:hypothetical protein